MLLVYVLMYPVFLAYVMEIELYEVQRDTHIVSSLSILGQLNKKRKCHRLAVPLVYFILNSTSEL